MTRVLGRLAAVERTLLLLAVPVLAVGALAVSSKASSAMPPVRHRSVAATATLTPAASVTTMARPTPVELGPDANRDPAEVRWRAGGDAAASRRARSSRASALASPPATGVSDATEVASTTSGSDATSVVATTTTLVSDLPGQVPAPVVEESQSPIFLVLVALAVVALAVIVFGRSARRRRRQQGPA